MAAPIIDIILVTYNRSETLQKIIGSVRNYRWSYNSFLIVNNNSTDGSGIFLNSLDDSFNVLNLSENVGHGAALAKGLQYLNNKNPYTHYTIFLEDDSIPEENLYYRLLDNIANSDFDLISSSGKIVKLGKRIEVFPNDKEIMKADFCLFDGAVIKNKVFDKIGYPVEDWFMMFDDFEYCYRIRKNNFKIGIIKNDFHQIMHHGAGDKFSKTSLWRGYYQTRNHIFFLRMHFTLFNLFDFLILNSKRTIATLMAPDRSKRFTLRIIGLYHGIINKKGKTLDPATIKFRIA